MPARKLGRQGRAFDPRVPHMSSVAMGVDLKPPPAEVDWTAGLGIPWGMMKNDELGCCTCAAAYHFMQICSAHGRERVLTEPDDYVVQMYREFAGYQLHDPSTDNGAVEQEVLRQWLQKGVPIQEGTATRPGPGRSKLRAYVEVDPRSHDDVKRAVNDCGAAYIGFEVPAWLMKAETPEVWDKGTGDRIVGGHAVILPGYDDVGPLVVSWGALYRMTWEFFDRYTDEVYALAHPWWIDATGKTPLGLPIAELEKLMGTLRRRA